MEKMDEMRKTFLEALANPEFEWKEVEFSNPLTKDPDAPGGLRQEGDMIFIIKGRRPVKLRTSVWEKLKAMFNK